MTNTASADHDVAAAATPSLYSRLGGGMAISQVVENFYQRVLADEFLRPLFDERRLEWLKTRQKQFFTQATGGPQGYRGASMRAAHRKLALTQTHFDHVAGHLVATLQKLKTPKELIDEVVALVSPLAADIVSSPTPAKAF